MKRLRQFIRDHRRSWLLERFAIAAQKYLRAWYNEDFYDFRRNGESFVLCEFANWQGERPASIWDVGAHRGGWAAVAHEALPQAHITSFEMIPQIHQQLVAFLGSAPWSSTVWP